LGIEAGFTPSLGHRVVKASSERVIASWIFGPMPSLAQKRASLNSLLRQHPPSDCDPRPEIHGVLLSDEIAFYANNHNLITPFDRVNLKPAAYELTIGDEYFLSGEFLTLDPSDKNNGKVVIPPFEVAVLKTTEILCLPRYLIARWNIRVRHAYSGLLWVGGPQVDPGYVGHLFCPIYNLSDKAVTLYSGDPIAVIDFVKTTPFDKNSTSDTLIKYTFPPKKVILEDYGIDELRSALFTRAGTKLVEFEEKITNLETRFITFTQITFAIFSIALSLVAVSSKVGFENLSLGAVPSALTFAISVDAILVAIFSYIHWRVGRLVYEQYGRLMESRAQDARRFLRKAWWSGILVSILISSIAGFSLYGLAKPFFQDVRERQVLTKSDLDNLNGSVSREIHDLSSRVDQMQRNGPASQADLERLKSVLEREIVTLKSGN
jgi:deoxycytidine triphosphate deaminase